MMAKYSIGARTLAANNMVEMLRFYAGVFDIDFKEEDIMDSKMYHGQWAGVAFTLIPAGLCQVTAKQNRMQYDIIVQDLDTMIAKVEASSGKTNGKIGEDAYMRCIGVFDPDNNFMVFKQMK